MTFVCHGPSDLRRVFKYIEEGDVVELQEGDYNGARIVIEVEE